MKKRNRKYLFEKKARKRGMFWRFNNSPIRKYKKFNLELFKKAIYDLFWRKHENKMSVPSGK